MTWVKVCGLRRREHVEVAVAAGADAVGFVLAAASPRYVSAQEAAALAAGVGVTKVVVTVDLSPKAVLELAQQVGADGAQPHGRHSAEAAAAAAAAGLLVLRPVPVDGPTTLLHVPIDQIPIVDAVRPGLHGGTGEIFDWSWLDPAGRRFVLAGGLTPDLVAQAVNRLRPWGVDASSGLEVSAGEKDPELIRRFVAAAKSRP